MKCLVERVLLAFACLLFVGGCFSTQRAPEKSRNHFSLPKKQESSIINKTSNFRISVHDLDYWDTVLEKLSEENRLPRSGDTFRLYAYFYCAIKAFADASFQLTSAYSGSVDPIAIGVIRLFYPDYSEEQWKTDAYSTELANFLLFQIKKRFEKEEKGLYPMQLPQQKNLWVGDPPQELSIPSMKPWVMKTKREFQSPRPPPPEDPRWKEQLEETKRRFRDTTPEQRERSFAWQEQSNAKETNWSGIARRYMKEANIPLEMQIAFREKFYIAMMDALIAVFYDKFSYMVARPIMRDPNFQPLFPTPHHPSYPSAHSAISNAAATVLAYYFPENTKKWNSLAEEAGISRIWAGIHFPIDNNAGQEQGNKIGKAVLFR